MKKFYNIIRSRLSIGLVLSVFFSFVFTFSVRIFLEYYSYIIASLGDIYLLYIGLLFLLNVVFSVVLEFAMGPMYHTPFSGIVHMMQDSEDKAIYSANGSRGQYLHGNAYIDLASKIENNLEIQETCVDKLYYFKTQRNIRFVGLEFYRPDNMEEREYKNIQKQVDDIEVILTKKYSEYNRLEDYDRINNGGILSKHFNQRKENVYDRYEKLFNENQ